MNITQHARESLERFGVSEWDARTTITQAETPSVIALPWITITISVKEHDGGAVLALAASTKEEGQLLLAAFPLPSGFQGAATPLESLVAFVDQYGIDLDLGEEPTRLVIGGKAGVPHKEFGEWLNTASEGVIRLGHEFEFVCSTLTVKDDLDIAILFGVDVTVLEEDL